MSPVESAQAESLELLTTKTVSRYQSDRSIRSIDICRDREANNNNLLALSASITAAVRLARDQNIEVSFSRVLAVISGSVAASPGA